MKKMLIYTNASDSLMSAIDSQLVDSIHEELEEDGTKSTYIWTSENRPYDEPIRAKDDIVDLVNRFNELTR